MKNRLHLFLQEKRVRAMILFPPSILIIIGIIIGLRSLLFNVVVHEYIQIGYLISILYLWFWLILIAWSDSKALKNKYGK